MASLTTWAILAIPLILILQRLSRIGQRPKGYPPGPPTLPIIGNLHQLQKEKPHLQFQQWAKEYGPVYSLILGSRVVVVLNTDQAVKDLLDKRSGIYSSRPELYLGQDIVSGGFRMLLMAYGETWRMLRRIVHNSLNINAARSYVPYQDLENKAMLLGFLEEPERFTDHIRRYTNSLTTQMVFGFRTVSLDDPKLKQLYHSFEGFSEVMGRRSAALADIFPLIRYLPDALLPVRRYAKELHRQEYDLFVGLYRETKRKLKEGTAKPCVCIDLVRAQETEGFSDGLAGYTSGSLLEAGSDTTAATLIGFIQALLIFPSVLTLAQAELDRVCGPDRLPDLSDLPNLPYIRGIIKESFRWMPTDVLGVPHAVIRDDTYLGYTIPKGAEVLYNVWAIAHDPERHPDPERFDPSRWAHDTHLTSAESANSQDAAKRDHFVFGAGRRMCQGMHIADKSLFLGGSRLLWAFDFRRVVDPETGEEVVPDMTDLTEGLFVQPRPFKADIRPRNEDKARRVREEWGEMEGLLDGEMQWKAIPEGMVWKDYEAGEVAR